MDMSDKKILVVGGDLRIIYLAELFKKVGYDIRIFGIDPGAPNLTIMPEPSLSYACSEADIIILPLPVSKDRNHINAPFFSGIITVDELFKSLTSKHLVAGGKLELSHKNALDMKNIKYFDYFDDEVLTLKNAAITAEGALMLAIRKTSLSLTDSRCMILGYGRIAKFLAPMLKAAGAKVCIAARRKSVLAEAELSGFEVCPIDEIGLCLNEYDIIFNTIPAVILLEKHLICLKDSAVVIDLASKPGGVDLNAADTLGTNLIQALSIPGKVAPESAGKIIFKTICNYLKEC